MSHVSHRSRVRFRATAVAMLRAVLTVALVAIGVVSLPLSPAAAQTVSAGTWTPAAAPTRAVVKAVALTNGKVLALSAYTAECTQIKCFELYDPASDAWTPVPPAPTSGDLQFTLTALRGGQALATFGVGGRPTAKFLYTGLAWVELPPNDRGFHFTPVLLEGTRDQCGDNCGKVLLAFGRPANLSGLPVGSLRSTADLYDPVTNTFTPTGALPEGRLGSRDQPGTGVLLQDGRVLVVNPPPDGGVGGASQANFFDPKSGTWSPAPDLPAGSTGGGHWSVVLPDGRVVLGGNTGFDGEVTYPAVFDPRAGSWRRAARCPVPLTACGAPAVMPGGKVLTVGQFGAGSRPPKVASIFDPDADSRDPATGQLLAGSWSSVQPDPAVQARSSILLTGSAAQCGERCRSVLALGETTQEAAGTPVKRGAAQIFRLLTVGGLLPDRGLACGGTAVAITGRGLERASAVTFGDQSVSDVLVNPDGSLTVRAPRHVAGPLAVPVTVRFADGSSVRVPGGFTFTSPGPATLSSLSVREGSAAGGTPVQIGGQFPAECVRSVTFGPGADRRVLPQGPVTAELLSVISPKGTPGELVRVAVEIDPGPPGSLLVPSAPSSPGAADFTYRTLPVIAGINPGGVSALGGTARLSGSGFERYPQDTAGPQVTIGGQQAGVSGGDATATGLTVTVPSLGPGRDIGGGVPVVVTTDGRGQSAPFTSFAYHPGVQQITPSFGRRDELTPVTLSGKGLAKVDEVRLGGALATITARSDTQLTVITAPRAVAETVPVQVVALGLVSLEQVLFRFDGPPTSDPEERGGSGPTVPKGGGGGGEQPALPGGPGGTGTAPVQASPPGQGSAPVVAPVPVSAPAPGQAIGQLPGFAQAPGLGQALAPGQAPAQAPVVAQAAGITAPGAPAGPAAAAAQGTTGGGGGPGSGQGAGAREQEDSTSERPSTRYAMNRASSSTGPVGLGAALMTGCFSLLMLRRRATTGRNQAGRAQPRGAY